MLPRATWTSEPSITRLADPMRGVSRITIHHDGMSPFYATDQASAEHRIEHRLGRQARRVPQGQSSKCIGNVVPPLKLEFTYGHQPPHSLS